MPTNRRNFLQQSAATAAAFTLGPLTGGELVAEPPETVPAIDPTIRAFELRMLKARPLPLHKVRVLGGPLKRAQDVTASYLLALDPDRMMAHYRLRAGLPKKAEPYEGWDGGGRNLTGHIAGHHLSGVSLMYRATGDVRFKARADYLVKEMQEVQLKNGDGYLGALEGLREAFGAVSKGNIRSGGFDLNGLWSPWYTLHKTFAGLRDAYRHTGNATALALEIKYAAWAESVLAPLSEAQVQKMLLTEYGGMNEVFADLYADTGNKRWLDLSHRFEHVAFTEALKRHQDNLAGKHGNCQIPKLIGSAARYGYTGDPADIVAASFFWDRVVQHHTYATGGHGLAEYFGMPDQLSNRLDGRTCETCNAYNMRKLSIRLFSFRPDVEYGDFHERVLFNHILASIDPADGTTSYMVPAGRGVTQEYQDMQRDFTCCVGSGMESHALHGDGIYYEHVDQAWVNLFVPSSADFASGMKLVQETSFPDGDTARIKVVAGSLKPVTIHLRRPAWAGDGYTVSVNGSQLPQPPIASFRAGAAGGWRIGIDESGLPPSQYVSITRQWKAGDTIEMSLPKTLRFEPTADNKRVTAVMWGPLVLAGDHGPSRGGEGASVARIPALVTDDKPLTEWLQPAGTPGDFTAKQVARVPAEPAPPTDLPLKPFYRTHRRRYSNYFDVITTAEFDARVGAIAAERERVRRLEAATVSVVHPGVVAEETAAGYVSEPANRPAGTADGKPNRAGGGWFSYQLAVDAEAPMAVVVTYLNEMGLMPAAGSFEILVDGTVVGTFEAKPDAVGYWDATYPVPATLVRGKTKVTVRFQATPPGRIVPIFGVRMVRAGAR
ncbi:MAG: glycoside hydrolase family 127 protein [Gemmatimonadales bacterium]|nr:glycoside hydrolase family 127 protein [Gemmatimonadales bacterium]